MMNHFEKTSKHYSAEDIQQLMDGDYDNWYKSIIWKKDNVILLGGKLVSKLEYIKPEGFDSIGFNKMLKDIYITKYIK